MDMLKCCCIASLKKQTGDRIYSGLKIASAYYLIAVSCEGTHLAMTTSLA